MLKQTPKSRVLFVRKFTLALLVLFGVFSFAFINFRSPQLAFATATNTVNFQARLQTASGGIVPDGNYNVEFKLYSVASGGTALWTEDYVNSASQGLQTVNGYLSANLGSITSFPSTIDWSQKLWLTMNIGGTTTGSVTWDGEMNPRIVLTAVPYAFQAGRATNADQLSIASGGNTSTLSIQAPTGGNQTFLIQDQGAAGTYNLLTTNNADASYLKLQGSTPGTAQTGNFNITGTGIAGTLQAGSFDTASAASLGIGTGNATSITIGKSGITSTFAGTASFTGNLGINNTAAGNSLAINAVTNSNTQTTAAQVLIGTGGTSNNGVVIQTVASQSTTTFPFLIQYSNGNLLAGIDASGEFITSGGAAAYKTQDKSSASTNTSDLAVRTGNASGTTSTSGNLNLSSGTATGNSGNVNIDSGTSSGGTTGAVNLGATNSSAVLIGHTGVTTNIQGNTQVALSATTGTTLVCQNASSLLSGCDSSYLAPTSTNFIQNQAASAQAGNFNIAAASGVAAKIKGAASQDIADFYTNSGGTPIAKLDQFGIFYAPAAVIGFSGSTNNQTTNQITLTNTNTGTGTVNSYGQTVGLAGSINNNGAKNNNYGTFYSSVTPTTGNTFTALAFGTGYDNLLAYNNAALINGSGILQSPALSGTYTNSLTLSNSGNTYSGTSVSVSGAVSGGSLQAASLDVSSGTLSIGTSNASAISFGKSGATTTVNGNTLLKTTSTTAFQIQDASNNILLTADTSTGTITFGTGSNTIVFTAAGGLVASGTAQHAKTISLYPEYAGAVFDAADDTACSSANNGTLSSGWDSTNRTNYYNWTSTSGTSQCYDVVVQVNIPSDWSSWAASDPINIQTTADNTSNGSVSFKIMNSSGTADTNYNYGSPSTSTSWTDSASSSLAGTYSANSTMYIKVRLSAKSNANVKLGAITLNYNSKY